MSLIVNEKTAAGCFIQTLGCGCLVGVGLVSGAMAVGLYAIISVGSNSKKAEKADKKPASTLHQRAEDYVEEATKGWKDSSIHKVEPLSPSFAQRQDGKEGGLAGKATERLAQQPESSRVLGS